MRRIQGAKFELLRRALAWHGITQTELAEAWNAAHPDWTAFKYQAWFSDLLNCKREWRLDEMYFVMDYVGIPHDQMHIYFPLNGVAETKNQNGGAV